MSVALLAAFAGATALGAVAGEAEEDDDHWRKAEDFVHKAPEKPSDAWVLSAGGGLYDTWWEALDHKKPEGVHPAYPAAGTQRNPNTWRCIECHGWDYRGVDGQSRSGPHFTGIKGVRGARGWKLERIEHLLRQPPHSYSPEMIPDEHLGRLARFISGGQHNAARHINLETGKARGDARRGSQIFQSICATCHGFDGKALNFGTQAAPSYVGTEANVSPYEVLHKIRNGHPGAAMVALRPFPVKDAANVLTYAQKLPTK
jgi:cytochrome c2